MLKDDELYTPSVSFTVESTKSFLGSQEGGSLIWDCNGLGGVIGAYITRHEVGGGSQAEKALSEEVEAVKTEFNRIMQTGNGLKEHLEESGAETIVFTTEEIEQFLDKPDSVRRLYSFTNLSDGIDHFVRNFSTTGVGSGESPTDYEVEWVMRDLNGILKAPIELENIKSTLSGVN